MSDQATKVTRVDRKKAARREALVKAALDLFRERGLHGTRVEDITERADTAKGAFYNYFESKDALVAQLLADAVRVLGQDYLAKLNGQRGAARVERLTQLHDAFLEEHPSYSLLLHQTRGLLLEPATGTAAEPLRQLFRTYLDLIADALSLGEGHAADHRDVAAVLAGGVAGARAFAIAAGLAPSRVAPAVLAHGVAGALRARSKRS